MTSCQQFSASAEFLIWNKMWWLDEGCIAIYLAQFVSCGLQVSIIIPENFSQKLGWWKGNLDDFVKIVLPHKQRKRQDFNGTLYAKKSEWHWQLLRLNKIQKSEIHTYFNFLGQEVRDRTAQTPYVVLWLRCMIASKLHVHFCCNECVGLSLTSFLIWLVTVPGEAGIWHQWL